MQKSDEQNMIFQSRSPSNGTEVQKDRENKPPIRNRGIEASRHRGIASIAMNNNHNNNSNSNKKKVLHTMSNVLSRAATLTTTLMVASSRVVRALSSSSSSSSSIAAGAGARCLGGTDLVVSEACLGTMTWGVQNTQQDAFEQIDYARSRGINFIDTAELYPVPLTSPQWKAGATEEILGNYIEKIGPSQRNDLVIASKIAGYFPNSPVAAARYFDNEPPADGIDCRLDTKSVKTACEASLRRLKTDRIDLYQIHWPDRYVPAFGQTLFDAKQKRHDDVRIEETASALRDLIEEGKVRYIGLSNETPFGVCEWIKACDKLGIRDKLATIQNSYCLLDRRFDSDLAEICDYYNIGLLPWSVLAGGLLSGKYRKDNRGGKSNVQPASSNSRFVQFPEYMSRWSPATASKTTLYAVDEYAKIAESNGITPSELAIAFARSRQFVAKNGSTIIGATTMEQLKENIDIFDKPLLDDDDEVMDAINNVHMKCRDPCCSL